MIPEAAVEEAVDAAKAFYGGRPPRGTRAVVRLALEAAAPHLLAEAWEAGREVGLAQDFEATTQIVNPHV